MVFENGFRSPFDMDDERPTNKQIQSTKDLVIWLDRLFGIESVVGHNQLNDTECPGSNANPYIPEIDEEVERWK